MKMDSEVPRIVVPVTLGVVRSSGIKPLAIKEGTLARTSFRFCHAASAMVLASYSKLLRISPDIVDFQTLVSSIQASSRTADTVAHVWHGLLSVG